MGRCVLVTDNDDDDDDVRVDDDRLMAVDCEPPETDVSICLGVVSL